MSDAPRKHEYELMSYGREEESLGRAWWNGKEVETDKPALLAMLKDTRIIGPEEYTIKDGIPFLEALPGYFCSYISARKVED